MNATLGRIKAQLAEPAVGRVQELTELINRNINPPNPVRQSEVYIRAMYVASNEVNSFGGRFPEDELGHLAELLVDSPVLVGHRKDKLPVARTFHAELAERDGRQWVKSFFYWLRSADGAENLKENIDGGIYKECSIGFTYQFPECSVCGKDIRSCRHQPLENYSTSGAAKACHFNYRQIERVLETSLVYRGAVPDTAVSKELETRDGASSDTGGEPHVISDPVELEPGRSYLMVPNYEAIEVLVTCAEGGVTLTELNGETISPESIGLAERDGIPEVHNAFGILVGYRGKQRCSVSQLRRHLQGKGSSVSRIELKLLPVGEIDGIGDEISPPMNVVRHVVVGSSEIDAHAGTLMTKSGVRLWDLEAGPPEHPGYVYLPPQQRATRADCYALFESSNGSGARLVFTCEKTIRQFEIKQFSRIRLSRGARFLADPVPDGRNYSRSRYHRLGTGQVMSTVPKDDGIVLHLGGILSGRFMVQPARLNGRDRFLIYHVSESDDAGETV